MNAHRTLNGSLFLLALAAGCGPLTTDPSEDMKVVRLALSAEGGRTTLSVNETLRLTVVGFNAAGTQVDPGVVSWTVNQVSDQAARLSIANGVVKGLRSGSGTVTATASEQSASLTLMVEGALHFGDVAEDEVWRADDNPHRVRGDNVYVGGAGAPTLTIEAGVVVRFAEGTSLHVGSVEAGRLLVQGTAETPVVFTADNLAPKPGDWAGLVFGDGGDGELRHLTIQYAGASASTGEEGCVQVLSANGKPVFDHVSVLDGSNDGIFLTHTAAFGDGSTTLRFARNDGYPVTFGTPDAVGTMPANSTFEDNAHQSIRLLGGIVGRTQTWARHAVPYVVQESPVEIGGDDRPVLTIAPGVTIRFGISAGMRAWGGELVAKGTEQSKITFTSDAADKQPGQWGGVVFDTDASATSGLEWVTVEYGGGGMSTGFPDANVSVFDDKGPIVKNTVMHHSAGWGLVRGGLDFATDFTAANLGNVFESNASGAQSGL